MLFPSTRVAKRCSDFIKAKKPTHAPIYTAPRILDLILEDITDHIGNREHTVTAVSALIMDDSDFPVATKFWQHTGDGISSRRAEMFHKAFEQGHLKPRDHSIETPKPTLKGPKRYRRQDSLSALPKAESGNKQQTQDVFGTVQFLEERFGRNLDMSLAKNAKLAIRKRIAGSITSDVEIDEALAMPESDHRFRSENSIQLDDIYLYPTGMSSIFNTHRMLLKARGPLKSIMFG
jgi:cystathionine gamma-synthase